MVQPVLATAALLLVVFVFLAARRARRLWRLLDGLLELPVVPVASTTGGLQRVQGQIHAASPLESPFHHRACAYFAFRVEESDSTSLRPRRLAVGKDWADFEVVDDSGRATIEARPALIRAPHIHVADLGRLQAIPPQHASFFERAGIHERHLAKFEGLRVVEYTLEAGDTMHVLGSVRSENGRKVFYRSPHSLLAVSVERDAGLVRGLRNELLLFSVSAVLFLAFAALFLVVALA